MVIENFSVGVEQVGIEFVGVEGGFRFLGFCTFLALPFDVVGPVDRVTDVFDGFEVIRDDPGLDVGLELPRLRPHLPVSISVALRLLLRVVLFDMQIGGRVEEFVIGLGDKLLFVGDEFPGLVVLLD